MTRLQKYCEFIHINSVDEHRIASVFQRPQARLSIRSIATLLIHRVNPGNVQVLISNGAMCDEGIESSKWCRRDRQTKIIAQKSIKN